MWGFGRQRDTQSWSGRDKRQSERFHADTLGCSLGVIEDISTTGIRLQFSGKPTFHRGQVIPLRITVGKRPFDLLGRITRLERCGFRKYDVGIAFLDADARTLHVLTSVARFGFVPKDELAQAQRQASRQSPADTEQDRASTPHAADASDAQGEMFNRIPPLAAHDPYQTLGVARDADDAAIHEAFRQKARLCHPDLNPAPEAEARFITLKQAYDLLRNPEQREQYDRFGTHPAASPLRYTGS